jgi:hypothetical protein
MMFFLKPVNCSFYTPTQSGPDVSGSLCSLNNGTVFLLPSYRARPYNPASPRFPLLLLHPWLEAATLKVPELKKSRKKLQWLH